MGTRTTRAPEPPTDRREVDPDVLRGVLTAVEQGFGYYVTDPATLRAVEEATR